MLIAEDLWLRHERRSRGGWVLDGVGLEIAPGKVVGLRGPSGCGKTTLGAVLGGLATPERGRVVVDDVPLAAAPPGRTRPVQVVLQHPEQAMNPRWRIDAVLAEAGAEPAAGETDLVDPGWLDRFPHEISGGELQRVNLARALRARPRYLVADEISASLDPITQALLWRHVLDHAAAASLGVLAISHDTALLDRIADQTLDFDDLPRRRG